MPYYSRVLTIAIVIARLATAPITPRSIPALSQYHTVLVSALQLQEKCDSKVNEIPNQTTVLQCTL